MDKVLTFIIPVRHPDNSKNWALLKSNLTQTIKSIAVQDIGLWEAVIVANAGADLPPVPQGFEIKWVDFPPNDLHERGSTDQERFYEAFRIDKGRRVLAGMHHLRPTGHVMIVDDDDFVSCKLAGFVRDNKECAGWRLSRGYVWRDSGRLVYLSSDFDKLCGTSHIIRSDLYDLPLILDEAGELYVRRFLGSHRFISEHLQQTGNALDVLPFPGAVYRIGHPGAHSKSKGILRQVFINKSSVRHPLNTIAQLTRLRWITSGFRKEFFGSA